MQVSRDSRIVPVRETRSFVVPDGGLVVPREGIRFRDVAPGLVRIWIDVVNQGPQRSKPTRMRIESAPLGAFVAWRPLREDLVVAPIAPGGTGRVTLTMPRPDPRVLGGAGRDRVRSLLTAAGFGRGPSPARGDAGSARVRGADPDRVSLLAEPFFRRLLEKIHQAPAGSGLAPSLLDLDGPRPHWVGNLNVWIDEVPVERHRAPRLRIHPGRANFAFFVVGTRSDSYAFRAESTVEDAQIYLHMGEVLALRSGDAATRWFPVDGMTTVFLMMHPPELCSAGQVVVHVTQRSSGREAAVEFDLDPQAPGPGCITL